MTTWWLDILLSSLPAVSESATSVLVTKSRRRRADTLRRASAVSPARYTRARQGDAFATITPECTTV